MKVYRVHISWHHRKWGPQQWTENVQATNQKVAAYRALRSFFDTLKDARERRDARKAIDLSLTTINNSSV